MRACTFLLTLALLPAAQADIWEDPDLAQALIEADSVIRARAPAASQGQPTVNFVVERVLKGSLDEGAAIEVGGLHDPTRVEGPTFAADEVVYLILRRDGDGNLLAPTPTFGRYPLRDGSVKYATPRDTFLRVDLPEEDWVRYLELHLGKRDDAWLSGVREHLQRGKVEDTGDARARHYMALEALALAGTPDDAETIARFLAPAGPFQLRISACRALTTALGPRAAANLFKAARSDPEPAVRTAATQLLGDLDPAPPGLVARLLRLFPEASRDTVIFVGINDPRSNTWPSPRLALIQVLRKLGPAPAKDTFLEALETDAGPEEAQEIVLALCELKDDPALPGQLVDRFRPAEQPDAAAYNRVLCAALARITGQELGEDTDAWQEWVTEHATE
jgi:hypothetical protein